jgi:RNA polymerase sigma-70 factor, ECF subfamily
VVWVQGPSPRSDSLVPDPGDETLLKQFVGGDQQAFAELMGRHEDMVFAICFRVLGDRTDALDATQDAFLTLFRRATSFRGEAAFTTWLYRIATNAAHDVLRKGARAPVPTEEIVDEPRASTSIEDSVALRVDLRYALAQLPEDYAQAVALHDLGGVPYDEIAAITGVSLGTVKSRISRGRRRLAEVLEQPTGPRTSKDRT